MPFADGMSTWPEGFASSNAHGCRPRSRWSSIPCSDRGGGWKWKDRGSCARFSLVDSLSDPASIISVEKPNPSILKNPQISMTVRESCNQIVGILRIHYILMIVRLSKVGGGSGRICRCLCHIIFCFHIRRGLGATFP